MAPGAGRGGADRAAGGFCKLVYRGGGSDDAPRVLTHRLTDRKHRHELLRFADALRRPPPPDIVEEAVEAEEEDRGEKEARAAVMVAGNCRLRRKRRKRERARKLEGVERGAGASARASAKKLLAESDELEAALRGWLRDAPARRTLRRRFRREPVPRRKPGFGGFDALRCICQNPDGRSGRTGTRTTTM